MDIDDIELLKFGRHFRLTDGAKLVVGRDREDNESLRGIDSDKYIPIRVNTIGPFSLIDRDATEGDKRLASKNSINIR